MTGIPWTLADLDDLSAKREHCIEGPAADYVRVSQDILGALPWLLAVAREHLRLTSALEFLDRGDGKRGTHGVDMRAPAILAMACNLGWLDPTAEFKDA